MTGDHTVLVVDDEQAITDTYSELLDDRYTVEVANSGEQALATLSEGIDVVLLDRRMPGLSGQDVLDEIRERGLDVRVAMVTAVDPDFDIAEMPFDTYLTKPVSDEQLRDTVDELLALAEYDEQVRERFAIAEKLAVLETEKTERELAESDEYAALQEQAAALDAQSAETFGSMAAETFEKVVSDIEDDP